MEWPQDVVLARPVDTLPRYPGLLYEPKWDGYWPVLFVDETGAVWVQSRRAKT